MPTNVCTANHRKFVSSAKFRTLSTRKDSVSFLCLRSWLCSPPMCWAQCDPSVCNLFSSSSSTSICITFTKLNTQGFSTKWYHSQIPFWKPFGMCFQCPQSKSICRSHWLISTYHSPTRSSLMPQKRTLCFWTASKISFFCILRWLSFPSFVWIYFAEFLELCVHSNHSKPLISGCTFWSPLSSKTVSISWCIPQCTSAILSVSMWQPKFCSLLRFLWFSSSWFLSQCYFRCYCTFTERSLCFFWIIWDSPKWVSFSWESNTLQNQHVNRFCTLCFSISQTFRKLCSSFSVRSLWSFCSLWKWNSQFRSRNLCFGFNFWAMRL